MLEFVCLPWSEVCSARVLLLLLLSGGWRTDTKIMYDEWCLCWWWDEFLDYSTLLLLFCVFIYLEAHYGPTLMRQRWPENWFRMMMMMIPPPLYLLFLPVHITAVLLSLFFLTFPYPFLLFSFLSSPTFSCYFFLLLFPQPFPPAPYT